MKTVFKYLQLFSWKFKKYESFAFRFFAIIYLFVKKFKFWKNFFKATFYSTFNDVIIFLISRSVFVISTFNFVISYGSQLWFSHNYDYIIYINKRCIVQYLFYTFKVHWKAKSTFNNCLPSWKNSSVWYFFYWSKLRFYLV